MNQLKIFFLLACCSCATVFNGSRTTIHVVSNAPGSEAVLNGAPKGAVGDFRVSDRKDLVVLVRADGYADYACNLTTSVGAGWVILDIVTGVVPLLIDAITGEWHSLSEKECIAHLRRKRDD